MVTALLIAFSYGVGWQHPAGMVNETTLREVTSRIRRLDWARDVYDTRKKAVEKWYEISQDELQAIFPKKRGNVYHNFSCPDDRTRLIFQPFECEQFTCPTCKRTFSPNADAGVYSTDDPYHGTIYDGWVCLFYFSAASAAMDMAIIAKVEGNEAWLRRSADLLFLFADTIASLSTDKYEDAQRNRILTYHREGDNKILFELTIAYELTRSALTSEQRTRIEKELLSRMLEDVMLEREYRYDHNNIYQWHRTILQTAIALEREDLIRWVYGQAPYDVDRMPEHRSINRIVKSHFKPDGAFWELCSGYHLYPMTHFCELAVLSHNLSRMDPRSFPPQAYDLTDSRNPAGGVIRAALKWFTAMAMPDGTMTVVGDSTIPRSGMAEYAMTSEVGYRFFDIAEVGDNQSLREGKRSWDGVLYGAEEITKRPTTYESAYLTSGWVSLRKLWEGNRVWAGLNALVPGGSHQHADRLTLTWYANDELLALEKATPYNESTTRVLGTLSPSHNTVTVDAVSQKQGESLTDREVPQVTFFYGGPFFSFATVEADNLYPQTSVYRRSLLLVEDILIDIFRVDGGKQYDWMLHHGGTRLGTSLRVEAGSFEPSDWLCHGTERVLQGTSANAWEYRWQVNHIFARLTMMGSPCTEVYLLETYPIDNAVVTSNHPPCNTLCVRRYYSSPFVAVWDSWKHEPNLANITPGTHKTSLMLRTRKATYRMLFGKGETRFDDGTTMSSDGEVAVARDEDLVFSAGGTKFSFSNGEKELLFLTDAAVTFVAHKRDNRIIRVVLSNPIQYTTYNGENRYLPVPKTRVRVEGNLWHPKRLRVVSTRKIPGDCP